MEYKKVELNKPRVMIHTCDSSTWVEGAGMTGKDHHWEMFAKGDLKNSMKTRQIIVFSPCNEAMWGNKKNSPSCFNCFLKYKYKTKCLQQTLLHFLKIFEIIDCYLYLNCSFVSLAYEKDIRNSFCSSFFSSYSGTPVVTIVSVHITALLLKCAI